MGILEDDAPEGIDVEKARQAGRISAKAREHGASLLREGAKLAEVAREVEALIVKEGGLPAFPVCFSLDSDAAHWTPGPGDATVLTQGALVKLDLGAHVDGYICDTALTVEIGTDRQRPLVDASHLALERAAALVKPGLAVKEIGRVIEETIRGHGFKPIVNLTGHSIERWELHAGMAVPNIARGDETLQAGTTIAIEPFATAGLGSVRDGPDGGIYHFVAAKPQRNPHARAGMEWLADKHPHLPFAGRWLAEVLPENRVPFALTMLKRSGVIRSYAVLREGAGGLVSQAEHTVLVTEEGGEILTR